MRGRRGPMVPAKTQCSHRTVDSVLFADKVVRAAQPDWITKILLILDEQYFIRILNHPRRLPFDQYNILLSYYCVLSCVLQLYTVISTLRWAVLAVLWIGFFFHTGPISLCIDSFVTVFFLRAVYILADLFVFMFVYFVVIFFRHAAYVLYYCNTVGWI